MHALGIDIGGTGIKAAPVDLETGKFVADRVKIATPQPALPDAVAEVVQKLVATFAWTGPIGCTFPGVVAAGGTRTAANLDKAWIGLNGRELLCKATGQDIRLINDADAAGVAEMTFGAGKSESGTVFMVTFGTGIGSALFVDGILVPNTEFGHIEIRGKDAEQRASERAKVANDLSWKHWAKNVNEYLDHIEALVSPQLIIVGGPGPGGRGHHQHDRPGPHAGGPGRQRDQRRPGTARVPGPGPAAGITIGVSGRDHQLRAGRP